MFKFVVEEVLSNMRSWFNKSMLTCNCDQPQVIIMIAYIGVELGHFSAFLH